MLAGLIPGGREEDREPVCRMIAAVGQFEVAPMLDALRVMALNANPAYNHEVRHKGDGLQHDCGWGVVYVEGDELVRCRSAAPCFDDDALDALSGLDTRLLILHARRTKDRDSIAEVNSHPFVATHRGETWAFCHNGEVRDRSQLRHDPALLSEGTIDSEELFLHVLTRLDRDDPASSLAGILGGIGDFTALNCFLATRDSLLAHARTEPGSTLPRYYTLWHGRGSGFDVVSSEIVDGIEVEWEPVADGAVLRLSV